MFELLEIRLISHATCEETHLQHQIDGTDQQIDHLVYGLYNLTEQEIQIVEEGKNEE